MTRMSDIRTDISGDYLLPGRGSVSDYFQLLKPRVMSLVIFTAFVGMLLAPGAIHPLTAFTALLAIAVGAGASGALNMWYDADIDGEMQRTAKRPIPMGHISRQDALGFGMVLSFFSVLILGMLVNWVAAFLLAFTIFFYVVIYTMWLKRSTPQNIVIGGAAGAFPPMIGWAAVTGSVSLESIVLFLIIFMWTPPHFWALSLYRARDYEKVSVPMLPVVAGSDETRKQILIYTVIMLPITLLPTLLGTASLVYGASACVLGGVFFLLTWRVFTRRVGVRADHAARALFSYSILYLFLLYTILMGEQLLGVGENLFLSNFVR